MTSITAGPELVAYCGLYCGACGKYLKGKCPGCAKNVKAVWCTVRSCCIENRYTSCAACTTVTEAVDCKKFNNFMSKVFSLIFRSDRNACISRIKAIGTERYAIEMDANKMASIKKK
jgi:hypothetical protein